MAGRASIVGAAESHVGKVRDHNEDAYFFDADLGVFLVCDGMGGHAAGEVASAIAVKTIRTRWCSADTLEAADAWVDSGAPDAKRDLLGSLRAGVLAAHTAIIAEGIRDETKSGMGTTLVGAMVVGGDIVFAHAGDSRAYLVRDGIAMQLTEDHTLLARLLAAGIDVDTSGEGSRFRSMLTNALGIGQDCKVSTFIVPLADGDRFLLCSDGVSEYVKENEVGEVLSKQPSPARAAQKLIDLSLERGGADNATAVVVRVLEAGETPLPAAQRKRDDEAIIACPLWGPKVTPQQRLRALRIAIPKDIDSGERLPPHAMGERVAWIIVEGQLRIEGETVGPGALVYPESLVGDSPPDRDGIAIARGDVRALALRHDDFVEVCEEDSDLGEALLEGLAAAIAERRAKPKHAPSRADTPVSGVATDSLSDAIPLAVSRIITPPYGMVAARPAPAKVAMASAVARQSLGGVQQQAKAAPAPVEAPRPTRSHHRPPTEPEIETVVEMEADDPPEPGGAGIDDEFESMTITAGTADDDSTEENAVIIRASEPAADDSGPEIEIIADEPPRMDRAITADDNDTVSGEIEELPPPPRYRARRVSDGWGEE